MTRQLALPLDAPRPKVFRHRASAASQAEEFRRDGPGYQGRLLLGGVGSSARGLTDTERVAAVRFARRNLKRNGVYGSLVNKLVEHTLGDGVVVGGFEDAEVEAHVQRVLGDRRNVWEEGLWDRWRDTLNEGEYLLTVETDRRNPMEGGSAIPTGVVRLGRFEVDQVRGIKTDSRNPDRVTEFLIDLGKGLKQWYPVAAPGVAPMQDAALVNGQPAMTGTMTAIAYWSVSRMAGRGTPKLLRILEKVQLVDDVVDSNARKGEYLNRFWVHGTYQATGDDETDEEFEDEALRFLRNAEPGEAFVSSEARKFEPKVFAPDLKVLDQQALYEMALDFVLGSEGIPRMWFSSGGDTNRATAVEQGSPIHRTLVSLQAELQHHVTELVRYLVWLGKRSGRVRADAPEGFTVTMASISTRDAQRDMGILAQFTATLAQAETRGYLTTQEAQRTWRDGLRAQTSFEVTLGEQLPEPPAQPGGVADLLAGLPDNVRESIRAHLPGHRRK